MVPLVRGVNDGQWSVAVAMDPVSWTRTQENSTEALYYRLGLRGRGGVGRGGVGWGAVGLGSTSIVNERVTCMM